MGNDSTAKKTPLAYNDCSVDHACGREMAVIADPNIMLHQRFAVDDAVSPHPRPCIDEGAMHDNGTLANLGMATEVGQGRNDGGQYTPTPFDSFIKGDAFIGALNLAEGDKESMLLCRQGLDKIVITDNRVAQYAGPDCLWQIQNAGDTIPAMLFDDIDAGAAMAAAADQNQTR